jgi:acyl-CoA thioesterase
MPFIAGVVPGFARHFEMRWARGGPPGSGLAESGYAGWIRFSAAHEAQVEAQVGLGPAWLAALVDAWPAPVLQTLRKPVFASSLTWAIDFVDHDAEAASDQWWTFVVDTDRAAGGWAHTRAQLWSPSGVLVATSSQTVAVFG